MTLETFGGHGCLRHLANLQNIMYRNLMGYFSAHISEIIFRRVSDLFLPHPVYRSSFNFDGAFQVMRKLRKHDCMRILKTWVNSWNTSYRYHETPRLPCVFGCDGMKDELAHYVMCPILFSTLLQLRPFIPPDPVERIGLIRPSLDNLLTVACIFAGYHSVRNSDHLHGLLASPSNLLSIHALHIFCETFHAEAMEVGLQCRRPYPSLSSSRHSDGHHIAAL